MTTTSESTEFERYTQVKNSSSNFARSNFGIWLFLSTTRVIFASVMFVTNMSFLWQILTISAEHTKIRGIFATITNPPESVKTSLLLFWIYRLISWWITSGSHTTIYDDSKNPYDVIASDMLFIGRISTIAPKTENRVYYIMAPTLRVSYCDYTNAFLFALGGFRTNLTNPGTVVPRSVIATNVTGNSVKS
ncbi:MAG: hypothetical protein CMK92_05835 [Pseudomonas sp.]|nr:hypothetical protein [Pseudomonas sp.]